MVEKCPFCTIQEGWYPTNFMCELCEKHGIKEEKKSAYETKLRMSEK